MPKKLRSFNDLTHAAAWMSERTKDEWEPLDLVDAGMKSGLPIFVDFVLPPEYAQNGAANALLESTPARISTMDLARATRADEFGVHLMTFGKDNVALKLGPPGLRCTINDLRVRDTDLEAFAEKQGGAGSAKPRVNQNSGTDWKESAREIGAGILKDKPHLSLDQIAEKTRKQMIAQKEAGALGMTGRGGDVPSAATIKRHAFGNIKQTAKTKGIRALP